MEKESAEERLLRWMFEGIKKEEVKSTKKMAKKMAKKRGNKNGK